MQQGFFYDFSNYGTYDRLTNDGITQWHPAFLALGKTLEMCAAIYRKFCQRYKPQPKLEKKRYWGGRLLDRIKKKRKPQKISPGQMTLWEGWEAGSEIHEVAKTFIEANGYTPQTAMNPG